MNFLKVKLRICYLILYSGIATCGYAQSRNTVLAYIDMYKQIALDNEKEYGIPAPVTLAQGILESGAGTSGLTRSSNNHFGIKAGNSWKGEVYLAWDDEASKSRFRCYKSAEESYRDHSELLTSLKCYEPLFDINIYDYRRWAFGLKKAGYATAPDYAEALIGIIDYYKLYEINGGAKLRVGHTVRVTRIVGSEEPVLVDECIIPEEVETEEESTRARVSRRYVVEINGIHCTVIQPGETLASICRRYDISRSDLLKYNELATDRYVREGDIIFLDMKKNRYEGTQDVYIVKDEHNLREVSQLFGVKIRKLARLNHMSEYASVEPGVEIFLK